MGISNADQPRFYRGGEQTAFSKASPAWRNRSSRISPWRKVAAERHIELLNFRQSRRLSKRGSGTTTGSRSESVRIYIAVRDKGKSWAGFEERCPLSQTNTSPPGGTQAPPDHHRHYRERTRQACREWVGGFRWNVVGIRHFTIYDNGSTDGTCAVAGLAQRGRLLTIIPWAGRMVDASKRYVDWTLDDVRRTVLTDG